MYDKLPFPRIASTKPEEQMHELIDYLAQFKEALEFELMEIVEDQDKLRKELKNIPRPEED